MTSIPVNNAKSLIMDFATQAPDKLAGTGETGSFTDVLNKQTESNQADAKADSVQAESAAKTQTKVNGGKRDRVKQEEVSKAKGNDADNHDKVSDALKEAGEEVVKEIAKELGITEEEVLRIMEVLGLTMADLMKSENMMLIVMENSGETDPMALLTNAELGDALKNLTQFVQNMRNEMQAAFSISEEQLEGLLDQMQEVNAGVATQTMTEEHSLQNGQPEIMVENLNDEGENIMTDKPVNDSVAGQINSEPMASATDVMAAEKGENQTGHDAKGQENAMNQNVFAQNLNQATTVQNVATAENISFAAQQTREIMNQIMDYMRIQIKPEMTQLEMQLHPESLGNVNVHIASKEGVITAQFTAQNETVKAAIESQLIQLKETFTEQGVKVEAIEVSVQANGFRQEYEDSRGGESAGEDDKKKSAVRRINLSNPELHTEDELSEEEQLAVSMMEANGNTVDYTA